MKERSAVDLDDEKRWVASAAQDPAAFTRLYDHYFPRVYRYARFRVDSEHEAEEVVTQTFLKVVETLGRLRWRHDHSFAAWVFRIARNVIIDKARRRHIVTLSLADVPEEPSRALSPDDAVVQKEEFTGLYHLLVTLPPRRQEVITLRFFGGLRNREIAQVLELDDERSLHTAAAVSTTSTRNILTLHQAVTQKEMLMNTRAQERARIPR